MPTQGPNSPGSSTTVDRGGNPNWSGAGNILTSNDSRATVTLSVGEESDWLVASNFGFSIPAGATITDILPKIEAQSTLTNSLGLRGVLFKTALGTDPTSEYGPTSSAGIFQGGDNIVYPTAWINADLWGTTWTPAEINASTFGVAFYITAYFAGGDCLVDHVTMTVDYTLPGSGVNRVKVNQAVRRASFY